MLFFFFLARHAKDVRGVVLIQQLSMCQEIRRKVRHVTKEKRLFFFSSFSNVQCNFVLDYRGLLCVFLCVCVFLVFFAIILGRQTVKKKYEQETVCSPRSVSEYDAPQCNFGFCGGGEKTNK